MPEIFLGVFLKSKARYTQARVALDGALEGEAPFPLWRRHLKKEWKIYLIGFFSVVATDMGGEIANPKIMQMVIDSFMGIRPRADFYFYFWILVGISFLVFLGRMGWRTTLAQQTHYVAGRFKSLLWNRARYFPKDRLEKDLSPGELMNVATGDVGTGRFVFGFTLTGTIDFVFVLLFATIMMLTIDVELTLWSFILTPILPIILDRLARNESRQHKESQKSLSQLTDLVAQSVSTIRLQRVTQTSSFWEKKLKESAEAYRKKRLRVVNTSLTFIPVTGLAPLISYGILIALGVKKVIAGQMTLGGFVAMQSYIFTIQGPLIELGVIISEWQRCFASLSRITWTFRQPEAKGLRAGGRPVSAQDSVYQIKNLSFVYPETSKEILKDFSLELKKGSRLGIKGPIGTGKSTLVNILAGFEKNFHGEVKLYGDDIRHYAHLALRQEIALVPQKPFLFADTVRNNIKLNRERSDDEIWRLLRISGLEQDVRLFPNGLETKLGEWGINLSGGQKQRLTLARALAAHPKILIMDDCLSAVDTVTEEKILAELDRELKDLTTIWVAHRSSTLKYCDRILEFDTSSSGQFQSKVSAQFNNQANGQKNGRARGRPDGGTPE